MIVLGITAAGIVLAGAGLYILYKVGEEIESRQCGRGHHGR